MTSTTEKERAYVVFQGGGALGIAHFGAWQAIARDFDIAGVAGTSSGSIVAALCAARVDPDKTFHSFRKNLPHIIGRRGVLWTFLNIVCRALFGRDASNDGSQFQKWLEQQLQESDLEKGNITFEELFQRKGVYLEVVVCDLKDVDGGVVIYSPYRRGRKPISLAVRASISLPGIFKTLRVGNRVLADGGLKLNFPIENLYQYAKESDCALIGVRFKKSPHSFNASNIRQVFSKSYELVMSNSSSIPEYIKNYPKFQIVEIDDRDYNPLNFKLNDKQLFELLESGKEAAEEQLEELQRKLRETKSKLRAQLPSGTRESVDEAQLWLDNKAMPSIEEVCKDVLSQEDIVNFDLTEIKIKRLCWEIRKYLTRVSESLFYQDYALLEDELLQPSVSKIEIYVDVLDKIHDGVPSYLNLRDEIRKRIVYLKNVLVRNSEDV